MNNCDKESNIKTHKQFLQEFDNGIKQYETYKAMLFLIALFLNHNHNITNLMTINDA